MAVAIAALVVEVITGRLLNGQFHLSNDVSALGDSLG
jgi:hypothetical protein